jgi:hypothetical protein
MVVTELLRRYRAHDFRFQRLPSRTSSCRTINIKVKVTLRPTASQPDNLGVERLSVQAQYPSADLSRWKSRCYRQPVYQTVLVSSLCQSRLSIVQQIYQGENHVANDSQSTRQSWCRASVSPDSVSYSRSCPTLSSSRYSGTQFNGCMLDRRQV